MPQIVTARVERQGNSDLYRLILNHDGRLVLHDESYTVCSRVAEALMHDEGPTEIQEIADAIKRQYATRTPDADDLADAQALHADTRAAQTDRTR
jgi:hypothetical protein